MGALRFVAVCHCEVGGGIAPIMAGTTARGVGGDPVFGGGMWKWSAEHDPGGEGPVGFCGAYGDGTADRRPVNVGGRRAAEVLGVHHNLAGVQPDAWCMRHSGIAD